ncbi:glutathione S-transferase family protein [Halopseudomonas laoshanensis]|uniref:glutathione S-transferase family protein n=1 Tax=Halopseudomonas laoshanensis TaxID=2268758 RepID=UPI0037370C07
MIKLHHLNQSRSKRIIWMLEELGVEYQLVSYQRDKVTRRAPAALKAINPLGRSPVIEDGDLVICESGAIIDYLVSRYGADTFAPPANTPAHARYVQWLHFAEGTAAFPLIALYLLSADNSQKCFLGGFAREQMTDVLTLANTELADKTYLMGDQFTGADVLNSFVFEKISDTRGLGEYPHLEEYMKRILARPAAQKAEALEREHDQEVG